MAHITGSNNAKTFCLFSRVIRPRYSQFTQKIQVRCGLFFIQHNMNPCNCNLMMTSLSLYVQWKIENGMSAKWAFETLILQKCSPLVLGSFVVNVLYYNPGSQADYSDNSNPNFWWFKFPTKRIVDLGKTYYFIGRLGLPVQIKRKRSLRSTADYKPCSNYMSGTYTCVYKSLHFKKKRHDPISLEVLRGEIPLLKASRVAPLFLGGIATVKKIRGIECVKEKSWETLLELKHGFCLVASDFLTSFTIAPCHLRPFCEMLNSAAIPRLRRKELSQSRRWDGIF